MEIKIKYQDKNMPKIEKIKNGDWIDLRASEDIELEAFEYKLIPLGISVQLPLGYEARTLPRSSTFKNFGIIQVNSSGVIDESYCGDNDLWFFPALAIRKTKINKYDRICQFRIFKKMEEIDIVEVESLNNENRGGIGSTGIL